MESEGVGIIGDCFRCLVRRKRVDYVDGSSTTCGNSLARALSVPHITAIGIGTTIGAGVYIIIGTVAREYSGPALTISFLLAGIAAGLSAFCYAELASRCPSAGSAYHYSYVCAGEGVAWLIGWSLMLEYTIGGAAIARGISPNLALLFGRDSLLALLSRQYIPGLDIIVDPCAVILVAIVTALLCLGIKESALAQAIVTSGNVCAMVFVIVAGGYLGFKSGWPGYGLPDGYFPLGINGVFAGSATVFFAYIGFDCVASTAEEVKNPQRDLPLGIAFALLICCSLYMLVSVVLVGLVPYNELNPDTPISSAFASHGMQWASYIITIGAITALCASLLGFFLPQPRVLMAMARDGLLPSFFSDVNKQTQVPVKSTVATGCFAAILAFCMDVSQLAGMVSVGTLLAFTMVALCVLIIRYVPPAEVPVPPSIQESVDILPLQYGCLREEIGMDKTMAYDGTSEDKIQPLLGQGDLSTRSSLDLTLSSEGSHNSFNEKRRKIAGWSILFTCVGALLLTLAASDESFKRIPRFTVCSVGAALLISCLIILCCINQDDARHRFGHSGGFSCPFIPWLPVASILINVYLLVNLSANTWMRVSIWLMIGMPIYVFYGRTHSSLRNVVHFVKAHTDKISRSNSSSWLA